MSELTEFILARIAEDEEVARAAVIPAWGGTHKPHPELAAWTYEKDGEVEYVRTPEMLSHPDARFDRIYVTCDNEGLSPSVTESVGPHIARHDPARVLAECEAKRRIVEAHQYAAHPVRGRVNCGTCGAQPSGGCMTLRLLALPYAGHEAFKEEWRP